MSWERSIPVLCFSYPTVLTVLLMLRGFPLERWEALTPEEREAFPRSAQTLWSSCAPSDSKRAAQEKMQEYIDNGARLGWLINPKDQQVEIYRSCQEEVLLAPTTLSGEQLLPGFAELEKFSREELAHASTKRHRRFVSFPQFSTPSSCHLPTDMRELRVEEFLKAVTLGCVAKTGAADDRVRRC